MHRHCHAQVTGTALKFLLLLTCLGSSELLGQGTDDYVKLRTAIVTRFGKTAEGQFGTWVKGVRKTLQTNHQLLALTFDACGGPGGNGYDEELIRFLQEEQIPATLFLSGSWIDEHRDVVQKLAKDTLFEIENHGLSHCPCSIKGKSRYRISGTQDVREVIDEIELNAIKITGITRRRPLFYRAATATTDEGCVRIAGVLGETVVSYDILPGDAVAGTPVKQIEETILKKAHPGGIVIMHMNQPGRNGFEALQAVVPELRKRGYTFVQLQHCSFR